RRSRAAPRSAGRNSATARAGPLRPRARVPPRRGRARLRRTARASQRPPEHLGRGLAREIVCLGAQCRPRRLERGGDLAARALEPPPRAPPRRRDLALHLGAHVGEQRAALALAVLAGLAHCLLVAREDRGGLLLEPLRLGPRAGRARIAL